MARRILDVIVDVLTLLALTLTAVMHVAFNGNRLGCWAIRGRTLGGIHG